MPLAATPLAVYQTPHIDGNTVIIDVPWYQSAYDEWCWAACAQMIAYYYQQTMTDQCILAKAAFPGIDCCQNPGSCNSPIDLAKVNQVFKSFGKSAPLISTQVEFEDIRTEILASRPVQVGFSFNDGNNHVAVVAGVSEDNVGQLVWVNDPDPNHSYSGWLYYSNLQLAYGFGSWQWTWMPIR